MATPDQLQRRLQARDMRALAALRKHRRERAEIAVAVARDEESRRRDERMDATRARAAAQSKLEEWNLGLTAEADAERVKSSSSMPQPIFEFQRLSTRLRRHEFAEFAALKREASATQEVATSTAMAKAAAIAHEKILECLK